MVSLIFACMRSFITVISIVLGTLTYPTLHQYLPAWLSNASSTHLNASVAPTEELVYICDSPGAYAYHSKQKCEGLQRCRHEILHVPLSQALAKGKQKICGYCKK